MQRIICVDAFRYEKNFREVKMHIFPDTFRSHACEMINILQDEDLVDWQKDDLTGVWLIRRNNRERPKHLQGSNHHHGENPITEDSEQEVDI